MGYPGNGGTTVSVTYGKVSGFEDDTFKIDANLDSGNSGGGVFNASGDFVGVPTSVKDGHTSLGYAKNLETVQAFIAGKSAGYTAVTKQSVSPDFLKHLAFLEKTPV